MSRLENPVAPCYNTWRNINNPAWRPEMDYKYRDADATNPTHYRAGDRETIDIIRETLGDEGFQAYCLGNAMKYEARAGLKPGQPKEQDLDKALWYRQMAWSVRAGAPEWDPRRGLLPEDLYEALHEELYHVP